MAKEVYTIEKEAMSYTEKPLHFLFIKMLINYEKKF